ncbi:hypothetical protein [Endozoicomonas sp. ISHI1]|uniref:hypothetical protein n=1 Tax=Endozoicomonas sp. ISHI1 TaxID=2825882 RepID=UPI002147C62A|nr:hypothetical protein [Endozoicomonas sp. ISHI1]
MNFDIDTFPSVKLLAQQVEKVTGKSALITIDPSMDVTISTQVTARTDAQPVHLVKINSRYQKIRHVMASVQLRHILHRYQIKTPEKDVTLSAKAIDLISELLKSLPQLTAERRSEVAKSMAGHLVVQLRSALPSVAVHYEIQKYQSELAEQQQDAIKANINNNLQALQETPIPKKIIQWNRLLAATESFGMASLIKDKSLLVPFESLGLITPAKGIVGPLLLGEYESMDDRELVEITAEKINMTELHRWI